MCFDGFFGGCFLMDFLGGCLGGYFGIVGVSWGGQSSSGLPLWVGYMCGVDILHRIKNSSKFFCIFNNNKLYPVGIARG